MTTNVRVRLLTTTSYAREVLPAGQELVVDKETGQRWVTQKIATLSTAPVELLLFPTCPRCGTTFEIPAVPLPEQRWASCPRSGCSGGWLR